jgi:aspartate beta-hydroxylase
LARVEKCLAIYLRERPADIADARQRPLYVYFPDLPPARYFPRDLFPWFAALESRTDTIREEALRVLAGGGLPSFLQDSGQGATDNYLRGTWDAFFFYRDGERVAESAARAPVTAALLEDLPLVRIRNCAPEICFSVLTPGSEILPHTGVTNVRCVTHLPLLVPADCAITVAGETHVWEEGRCVAFDDTYEHRAWNRNPHHVRVVLIVDAWNPYLTEVERAAIADLLNAIGDFNRAVDQPA